MLVRTNAGYENDTTFFEHPKTIQHIVTACFLNLQQIESDVFVVMVHRLKKRFCLLLTGSGENGLAELPISLPTI